MQLRISKFLQPGTLKNESGITQTMFQTVTCKASYQSFKNAKKADLGVWILIFTESRRYIRSAFF